MSFPALAARMDARVRQVVAGADQRGIAALREQLIHVAIS
jgi:hypothetical protein